MTIDWEGGSLEDSGKLDNPRYHCEHGTFVGDSYGPDYLCFYCEMGISAKQKEKMDKAHAHRRDVICHHQEKAKEHAQFRAVADDWFFKKYHWHLMLWHMGRSLELSGHGAKTVIGKSKRRYHVIKSSTRKLFRPIESAVQAALQEHPRVGS